jgi:hypothetical protein
VGRPITIHAAAAAKGGDIENPVRLFYRRTNACWAAQTLAGSARMAWKEAGPEQDYRDRDWHRLYAGSVLDD